MLGREDPLYARCRTLYAQLNAQERVRVGGVSVELFTERQKEWYLIHPIAGEPFRWYAGFGSRRPGFEFPAAEIPSFPHIARLTSVGIVDARDPAAAAEWINAFLTMNGV